MQRFKSLGIAIFSSLCLLTGCSRSTFNPYRHMTRIVTMQTATQFQTDKDQILAHIDPSLQQEFIDRLNTTIYDESYSITERDVHIEQSGNKTKILAEYDCTSIMGIYIRVVYFEYVDDILVDYHMQKIEHATDIF